ELEGLDHVVRIVAVEDTMEAKLVPRAVAVDVPIRSAGTGIPLLDHHVVLAGDVDERDACGRVDLGLAHDSVPFVGSAGVEREARRAARTARPRSAGTPRARRWLRAAASPRGG